MENRFGVKDFILFTLIIVLIGFVVLAMVQMDRQWDAVQKLQKGVADIRSTLANGVRMNGATSGPTEVAKDDPFIRIRAAMAMPGYAKGDWMIEELSGQLATITPLVSSDLYARYVHDLVLETLISAIPFRWNGSRFWRASGILTIRARRMMPMWTRRRKRGARKRRFKRMRIVPCR